MSSIRERILARPDLQEARAARDIDALANGLNQQPESVMQERYITARTILVECADEPAILDALEAAAASDSAVKWAITFLGRDSGLNVGDAVAQAMIDRLATAGALTSGQATALKNLALQPVFVTREQVEAAMFNPNGSEK